MHFCSVHRLFDALAHDITQTGYGLEAALRGTRQAGGAEVPGGGGGVLHTPNEPRSQFNELLRHTSLRQASTLCHIMSCTLITI